MSNANPALAELTKFDNLCKEDLFELVEYGKDQKINALVTVNNNYRMDRNDTLLLFDFCNNQIKQKYNTLIVDLKQNLVLSTQKTHILVNRFLHEESPCGRWTQDLIAKSLGITRHHTVSLGYRCFFSLHGMTKRHTDWVALHHCKDYNYQGKKLTFSGLKIGEKPFEITYHNIDSNIKQRLRDSIHHNYALRSIFDDFCLSYLAQKNKQKTLLDDKEILNGFKHQHDSLLHVIEDISNLAITRSCHHIYDEIQIAEEDLTYYLHKVKRNQSIN
ncbi:hypothetical protein FC52_GL001276 [Lactobacillus pasteurii DSM 23907 = CRBIP 24.76]|uniref:Uncharacterized protein n=1 Tax=Lactobacillus pasteurii DSM 23907 = CRBIP 24.76 TaxID=1423790 RepID=I7LBY7_9LACO|nr:hypothetical protein [Lactobacillus pasteurii]KRK07168.1 hypothetical protein FC52_GL001276 [Lactobacillus pasteurii DSM 23907 = CRBIP 24.76]TDG76949.1 hypothetical protein C5L33_001390 [Lactobacillus pasteurii]CCI86016.1 Putative uncharacterized protein [Lactobacillus pasteurii DSM 23907 = CRBIP 24.76]